PSGHYSCRRLVKSHRRSRVVCPESGCYSARLYGRPHFCVGRSKRSVLPRRASPAPLYPSARPSHTGYKRTTILVSWTSESRNSNRTLLTVLAVMPIAAVVRRPAVLCICLVMAMTIAPSASADPDSDPGSVPADAAQSTDGQIPSGAPATVNTPDGWTLT